MRARGTQCNKVIPTAQSRAQPAGLRQGFGSQQPRKGKGMLLKEGYTSSRPSMKPTVPGDKRRSG